MSVIIGLILNMFASAFLAWEAFKQRERADELQKLNIDILKNNDDLLALNKELSDELREVCSGIGRQQVAELELQQVRVDFRTGEMKFGPFGSVSEQE